MPELVKFQVGEPRILQDLLVDVHHRVGVVHLAGYQGGKLAGIVRVFVMLLDQQVDGILGDRYQSNRALCLWLGEDTFPIWVADVLLADRDGPLLHIHIGPEESHQLAFLQSADQLQIKHGQGVPLGCGAQIGPDVFQREHLHLYFRYLGRDIVIGRIALNQPLFHRPLKGAVEHEVEATYCGVAEAGPALGRGVRPAVFLQVLIKLLQIAGSQLGELDAPDTGDGVNIHHQLVAVLGASRTLGLAYNSYQVRSHVATV